MQEPWDPSRDVQPLVPSRDAILATSSCYARSQYTLLQTRPSRYKLSSYVKLDDYYLTLLKIQQKLMRFKFHILITLILFTLITTLILIAPKFLTILAYFWPLLLSTALFLIAVLVFAKTSLPPATSYKTGEGLLDYVAGESELHHHHNHDHHDEVETTVESSSSKDE
ncbi:hypothetical protein G4B88_016565 [Cannabis sativa]|uniref:Uncharacterized protein n=1 Tax=Cannabis sativa TaxID=3483 RepID=A0A7J6H819_CANSA|nr:hypothetical protein G4B88_016565 [Cannabis sativa]